MTERRVRRVHPPRHPSGFGIDLEAWHEHVRRIVVSKFGAAAVDVGVEPDELVAHVYERILRANRGRAAYDPSRASMSRYVCLQARSALANILDARRVRPVEELGLPNAEGELVDAASVDVEAPAEDDPRAAVLDLARDDVEARALLMLAEGATDLEVVAECGHTPRVMRLLAARGDDEEESRAPAVGAPQRPTAPRRRRRSSRPSRSENPAVIGLFEGLVAGEQGGKGHSARGDGV